jgi:hypothetical protein
MDKYDDYAGGPLWTIPPSDEEVRSEFVRLSKVQVEELRSIDTDEYTGDIDVSVTSIVVPEDAEPEVVEAKVSEAINILESMSGAVESGEPGQSILVGIYKDEILYGFVLNPETGVTMQSTAPVRVPNGMGDMFRTPVILGILNHWSTEMNAVVAWDAIRILNADVSLPDTWPVKSVA